MQISTPVSSRTNENLINYRVTAAEVFQQEIGNQDISSNFLGVHSPEIIRKNFHLDLSALLLEEDSPYPPVVFSLVLL